ncbi:MAG: adenosylcobinamide-GDP ribazoletransferase [Solirubrobacteraceae bacterium]
MRAARHALDGATLALGLLTVIPARARTTPGGLGSAAGWFPAVGALVGLAAGAVRLGADPSLGPGVAAVLSAIALVAVTGALHQDGLADCADALGVRGGRERRLAVMRDSTIGAFGMLALALWAVLLVAALAALPRHQIIWVLVLAGALGRWAAVLHAAALPPARRDGLGAAFAPTAASVAVASAMVIIAALLHRPIAALASAGMGIAVALAVSTWARHALGGRTGDTLGATVALTEVLVCVVLLGFVRQ